MRKPLALGLLFGFASWSLAACDGGETNAEAVTKQEKAEAPTPAAPTPPPLAPAAPPEPMEGAIVAPGTGPNTWLHVQTCAEPHACPDLIQPEGDAHCKALELSAGVGGWRLPTREEVHRFAGREGLEHREGYHWTSSPYEDDPKQIWIVDPAGSQPTTIPGDRKPFRVRCVHD